MALAIDMAVAGWKGGRDALAALGQSFGVFPLKGDPPPWSVDGH